MNKTSVRCYLAALLFMGCTQADSAEPTGPTDTIAETAPVPPPAGGTVAMQELSDTRIAGTYTVDGDNVEFEARVLEPDLMSTTVKLHGMTIDSTLDTRNGSRMWSQDAFATDTGADTVIGEEDQAVLYAFVKVLEREHSEISRGTGLAFHFGSVINYWAQWIPAMQVTNVKFEDRDRATDMCYWAQDSNGQWPTGGDTGPTGGGKRWQSYDGHDCNSCSGDPMQGQGASSCSTSSAYGNWNGSSTYYWYNNTWNTGSLGHGGGTGVYIVGDCFGRYGADCGSGHAYFRENGSHDHCVRNGHNVVSSWCSDELYSTTSPYNCY